MDQKNRILPNYVRPEYGNGPAPARRNDLLASNNKVGAKLGEGMLEGNRMTKPKSIWDVLVSFLLHTGIVVALILIPMLYTNALDLTQYQKVFLAVPPPPPPPPPPPAAAPHQPKVSKKQFFKQSQLYTPKEVPKAIAHVQEQEEAAPPEQAPGVVGGVPGGMEGGVVGGVLGGTGNGPAPPPKPQPKGPVRVGGNVKRPELVHKVEPQYPPLARQTRVKGNVVIDCVIDKQGNVTQAKIISGHPLLVQSALAAVKQWKFKPTTLNGQPVDVAMTVTVQFNMANG